MCSEDDSFAKGDVVAALESVKAAADVYAPAAAEVEAVNEELSETPELINQAAGGEKGWIVKLAFADVKDLDALMDQAAYDQFCKEQADN